MTASAAFQPGEPITPPPAKKEPFINLKKAKLLILNALFHSLEANLGDCHCHTDTALSPVSGNLTERAKVALGKAGPMTSIREKYSVTKETHKHLFFPTYCQTCIIKSKITPLFFEELSHKAQARISCLQHSIDAYFWLGCCEQITVLTNVSLCKCEAADHRTGCKSFPQPGYVESLIRWMQHTHPSAEPKDLLQIRWSQDVPAYNWRFEPWSILLHPIEY